MRNAVLDCLRWVRYFPHANTLIALLLVLVPLPISGGALAVGLIAGNLVWLLVSPHCIGKNKARASVVAAAFAVGLLAAALATAAGWNGNIPRPVLAVLLVGLTGSLWWIRWVGPTWSTSHARARAERHAEITHGMASAVDIWQSASTWTMRQKAAYLRPDLDTSTLWKRLRIPARDLGVPVLYAGPFQRISLPADATIGVGGGPRVGKSTYLKEVASAAPGALLTVSTRSDLAEGSSARRLDRAIHIVNPLGTGGIASTVHWSVLSGCDHFPTAVRRAADLIPLSKGSDSDQRAFWEGQARRYLAIMLYAIALVPGPGARVERVSKWIKSGKDGRVRDEILACLKLDDDSMTLRQEIQGLWENPDNTFGSIMATMGPGVAWVNDPRARAVGDADRDEVNFSPARLIAGRETLHLIGADQPGADITSLINAIVSEFAHVARLLGSASPGGRLAPHVTMALDEVAIATHLPIDRWSADFGGYGIQMIIAFQSLSQLRDRWGEDGADVLLGNLAALILLRPGMSPGDLKTQAELLGHFREVTEVDQAARRALIVEPEQLRTIAPGRAFAAVAGLFTAHGRVPGNHRRRGIDLAARFPLPRPAETVDAASGGAEELRARTEREALATGPTDAAPIDQASPEPVSPEILAAAAEAGRRQALADMAAGDGREAEAARAALAARYGQGGDQ